MSTQSRSGSALTVGLVLLAATLVLPSALAAHVGGWVEIDGNLADAPAGVPYDWATLFSPTGAPLVAGLPVVTATFARDHGSPDPSYHASSDKDIADIPTWSCGSQASPQDKTDILNAYAAFFSGSGVESVYLGFERATNNGNSFMGFWFLQHPVSCAVAPGQTSASFVGAHTPGDLLVLAEFTGGGSASNIAVYRWDPTASNNLRLVAAAADCQTASPTDAACGRVNGASLATPWTPGSTSPLATNTFFEAGLNLTRLLAPSPVPCISQFIAESRSSQELTAQLKDFAAGVFRSCDARISVSPLAATNQVGDPHTFTFTVEKNNGTGWGPADGETVTARISSGPGAFVGSTSCVTDVAGQCSVTIVSTTTGQTTLAGNVTVRIRSSDLVRTTDGLLGNSPAAVKTWVPAPSATIVVPTFASIVLGETIQGDVLVTGELGAPTGIADVYLCAPEALTDGICAAGTGASAGSVDLVGGAGLTVDRLPTHTGTWCFRADYPGDATYLPSSDAALHGCFVVTASDVLLSTTSLPNVDGVAPGTSVADRALVAGPVAGLAVPTGEVTFFLCGPADVTAEGCPTGGALIGAAPLGGDGVAISASTTATDALGTYCWRADYAGDANYFAATHTNADTECFVVRDVALVLDKAVSTDVASPGEQIVYTLTLTATGNTPATNVLLTDTVPARSTLVLCTGCTYQDVTPGSVITWELGSIPAPGSAQVAFVVQLDSVFPAGETLVPNVAGASSDQKGDIVSDTVTTVVTGIPGVALEKAVRAPGGESGVALDAEPGDLVEFTLTVRSVGSAPASNIVVQDILPPHTTLVDCGGCSFDGSGPGSVLTWSVAELAPPESTTLSFTVQLDPTFPAGTTVVPNAASVGADGAPSSLSNTVLVTVVATPDLRVAKRADAASATEGDLVTFTIDAYNLGLGDVESATITDAVPDGTAFISCSGGCSVENGVVTWNVGAIPALTSPEAPAASVALTVQVLDVHGCEVCNVATLTSPAQAESVSSELVCLVIVPDLDRAMSSGAATGLELVGLGDPTVQGAAASEQNGVGDGADASEDQLLVVPEDGSGVSARSSRVRTTTSVAGPGATTLSYAEVLDFQALGGAVSASKLRAVAEATATSADATYSSAGTSVHGLSVMGVPVTDAVPGTRIALPAELFGAGSYVLVGAAEGASTKPETASGGLFTATLTSVALSIHVTDADVLAPGAQPIDIVVARAVAAATFPQATPCTSAPETQASASSSVLDAGGARLGASNAPEQGGSAGRALASATADGARTGAATSGASTQLGDDPRADAFAQVAGACLLGEASACLVSADAVRAQAAVSEGAGGTTVDAAGSSVAGLVVDGTAVGSGLAPGSVIDVPGAGFLVVDERIEGASSLLVRGLRLVVTEGPLAGTQIIVAQAAAALA